MEDAQFIVIVVNSSTSPYLALALKAVNSSVLEYSMNSTNGVIISRNNVWADGQTVFVLAGYKDASALSSALLSFFVKAPVYAPHQAIGRFVSFNGMIKGFGNSTGTRVKDPFMDAVLDGTYELGPHDSSLTYPYSYYENFAYLIYYAPVITSDVEGILGNSSGTGLPMSASVCIPPPPPPEGGSSICVGDYVAMPMLQVGSAPPQRPDWSFDTGDCTFFGIDDCIDAEGYAASGLNPQLPNLQIPSVYYGFTATGSDIPPSMTGTSGPVDDSLPITWWVYGPGSLGESTGGFQGSIMTGSETALLLNDSVEMFSAPTSETPLGNFTVYNASNASATYSCSNELCGMRFNYSIYALMTVSSTIPSSISITSPHGYSPKPESNYYAVLEPVTLSTPKVVKTASKTYYFSYWSVDSELDGNQYHQQFNTSNATFQLIGPTQAQAVYTSSSAPGTVTIDTEAIGIVGEGGCLPPFSSCTQSGIADINISLTNQGGTLVYSGITGTSGQETTSTLPGGCYQVNADARGYILLAGPDPVCVNGPSSVLVMMLSPLVYNVSWPAAYPYGGAPVNTNIPINLTLLYAYDGLVHDGGVTVGVKATGGFLSSPLPQPGNGTLCTRWFDGYNNQTTCGNVSGYSLARTNGYGNASFTWRTPGKSGLYYLNFTSLVAPAGGPYPPLYGFKNGWVYSIPVVVYSNNYSQTILNISISKNPVNVAAGSSVIDSATVRACQYRFNLGSNAMLTCTPYPAKVFVTNSPTGVAASFSPNPVTTPQGGAYGTTLLNITAGVGAANGIYTAQVSATMAVGNTTYHSSIPLVINVSSRSGPQPGGNTSSDGALNITVFYNGTPAGGAEISSPPRYGGWYTGSNGDYYTGYTIAPGSYELIATYDNLSNSTTASVNAGKVAYADIYIMGAVATNSTNSTSSQKYYTCNLCYHVVIAGNYSCPSSCPTQTSCPYGGFECT